jgi:hypothetical protein
MARGILGRLRSRRLDHHVGGAVRVAVHPCPRVPPPLHPGFYNRQLFTLNLTRSAMARTGWSPSVRLFEAAACGVPVISDDWPGLERVEARVAPDVESGPSVQAFRTSCASSATHRRATLAASARAPGGASSRGTRPGIARGHCPPEPAVVGRVPVPPRRSDGETQENEVERRRRSVDGPHGAPPPPTPLHHPAHEARAPTSAPSSTRSTCSARCS